ncbi:MAG: protein kinase [Deltaproteobacteria bacterium]|nr:protein kinase [Deltaproteobacteria bacterium]
MSLRYPIEFGRHLLLERVNVGGMAEVFKAKAFGVEGFERIVAVKRILPALAQDEEFVTMFVDEARIAAHLTHQNIVQIYELGKEDGTFFISMEYVAGKDLRQVLDDAKAPLGIPRACHIVSCIAEALDYAHQKRDAAGKELRIIHRDVTPQNVIISYEGEVKLCDFGIAKAATRASRTQVGVLKGKFAYMSPEQVRGQPTDRRSDLFALGVVFYEMVTGQRLFLAETDYGTLEAVRTTLIPPPRRFNPAINASLEAILLKLLAREPRDRYQWASELHDDLAGHVMEDGRAYHARHLRTWMRSQYEEDIAAENAKLEAFMRVTPSGAEDTSTEEAEAEDLAESPSVVLALSAERAAIAHDLGIPPSAASASASATPAASASRSESRSESRSASADEPDPSSGGPAGADTDPSTTLPDTHIGVPAPDEEEVEPTLFDLAVPQFGASRGDRTPHAEPSVESAPSIGLVSPAELLRRLDAANLPDDTRETLDASVDLPSPAGAVPRIYELAEDTPAEDERATQSNERIDAPIELVEQPTNITDAFYGEEDTRESAVVFEPPRPSVNVGSTGSSGRLPLANLELREDDESKERIEADAGNDAIERNAERERNEARPLAEANARSSSRPLAAARAVPLSRLPVGWSLRSFGSDPRMNIAVASIVGVLAIGLLFALLLARSTKASLQVVAEPEGPVQVFLDGALVGEGTPVHIEALELGLHVIELRRGGFKPYVQAVQIQENKPHTMVVPLELEEYNAGREPATRVDDVVGPLPSNPGTDDPGRRLDVTKGGVEAIPEPSRRPAPPTPPTAEREKDPSSRAEPKGEAFVPKRGASRAGGASAGDAPRARGAGDAPRARGAGDAPRARGVGVEASSGESGAKARKPTPAAAPGAFGFLVVATRPPGVSVMIDEKPIGARTPIRTPIRLSAGTHVISFELTNGRRYDFDFEIEAGETTRLTKQLR